MKKKIYIFITMLIFCMISVFANAQTDTITSGVDKFVEKNVQIAYGEKLQKELASSVSTIKGDELANSSISNLGNTLFGRLSGLFVNMGSGEPGVNSPSFRIRGGYRAPLVIVDGFERDLTYIVPEEIESISVLKDASALAVYGMKGANGAIVVTTKRGKIQKAILGVSIETGVQSLVDKLETVDAGNYMSLYNQAAQNDGLPIKYSQSDLASAGTSPRYPDNNWSDLVLREFTEINRANFGVTGGNEQVKYYVNLGFLYDNGIYKPENPDMNTNANLKQLNVRSNLDINVTSNTIFSINLSGNVNHTVSPSFDNNRIWQAIHTLPANAFNAVNPDGSYGGTSVLSANNPVAMLETGGRINYVRQYLNADFGIRQDFDFWLKGLSAGIGYVVDNSAVNGDGKWRNWLVREVVPGAGEEYSYYSYGINSQYNEWSNANGSRNNTFDADIRYDMPEFSGNKLDVMVRFQSDEISTQASDIIPYLTNNFAGRISYVKNNKYLLDVSASYYGSDQYISNKQYGIFPAASVGWVFSEENFLEDNSWLLFGKVKASYGITGYNRYVNGRYPFTQFYTGGGSFPLGVGWNMRSGLQPGMLANPSITWEKTTKMNIGLEMGLFDRLYFTAEYYTDRTTDFLVVNENHAAFTGVNLPFENSGEFTTSGLDIQLGYISKPNDFEWHSNLMFSYFTNTMDEIGESQSMGTYEYLNRTGHSFWAILGLEQIGVFESEQDIQNSPKQMFGDVIVGDLKYKDQNGDGIIDSRDRTIASEIHDNIDIGLSFGFKYKNFDLNGLLHSRLNNVVNLNNAVVAQPFLHNNSPNNFSGGNDFLPMTLSRTNNYEVSDFWIRDADYIKLRNIELGYTLHTPEGKKLSKMRFFLRGVNVLTLSKWEYSDPEFVGIGYPPVKSYILGLNFNF